MSEVKQIFHKSFHNYVSINFLILLYLVFCTIFLNMTSLMLKTLSIKPHSLDFISNLYSLSISRSSETNSSEWLKESLLEVEWAWPWSPCCLWHCPGTGPGSSHDTSCGQHSYKLHHHNNKELVLFFITFLIISYDIHEKLFIT